MVAILHPLVPRQLILHLFLSQLKLINFFAFGAQSWKLYMKVHQWRPQMIPQHRILQVTYCPLSIQQIDTFMWYLKVIACVCLILIRWLIIYEAHNKNK